MPVGTDFSELLQQAEQITADLQGEGDLPPVTRNLFQIAEAGQRLLKRTGGAGEEPGDVKAAILLGSQGFDLPRLAHNLEQLNAARTLEPIEPVTETDIPGFLKNERENTILSVIEESKKETFAEVEAQHWKCVSEEWEREKERILGSLLGGGQELASLPSSIEVSSVRGPQGRSAMDAVERVYAREVYARNEAILTGVSHDLVHVFYTAMQQFQDKNILDCWLLVKTMLDVPHLPEKAYAQSRKPPLQNAFINQARMFLEKRYYDYISTSVTSNLAQAGLGGIPGTLPLVRSFLNLRHLAGTPGLEDGSVQGQPTWAVIYFCLRCGDMPAAIQATQEAHLTDREFPGMLQEYAASRDHRLDSSSQSRLQMTYRKSVRSSSDPYKKAVYCLLACCDFNDNHPNVIQKTDDYIWYKLCQVSLDAIEPQKAQLMITDRLSLQGLQTLLLEEYGEDHFNASQNPYLYFQVLILTAQFEAAIDFLHRVERLRSHAVHFAIALKNHNLLHLTESPRAPLLQKEPAGGRRINFARMVINYTRKFSLSDPREALQYLFLLKGIMDDNDRDLFVSCVTDLALENKGEHEMLLGKVERDGTVKPGCIAKFVKDTSEIITSVAEATERKGMYQDAIRLYDLAQQHDQVLEILCQELSQVVSLPCTPHSNKERTATLAFEIAERYKTQSHVARRERAQSFFLLMDLMQFFDLYHEGKLDVAFDVMRKLKLVPLSGEPIDVAISRFQYLGDEVRSCFADILLATMSTLHSQYRAICARTHAARMPRAVQGDDGGVEKHKSELRELAKVLITFAGMLPLQLPGDTYARLVQMEVLMH